MKRQETMATRKKNHNYTKFRFAREITSKYRVFNADSKSSTNICVRRHVRENLSAS